MSTNELRDVILQTRVTAEQATWIRQAAEREGITPSRLIRKAIGLYVIGAGTMMDIQPICDRPHRREYSRRRKPTTIDHAESPDAA